MIKATACRLACLFAFACCTGAQAEIPLRDFAKHPDYTDARLSPDGLSLSLKVPVEDQRGLVVIRLADLHATPKFYLGRDAGIADYWWVGNNNILFTPSFSLGTLVSPALNGELWAIEAKLSGDTTYLFGERGEGEAGSADPTSHKTFGNGYASVIRTLPDDPDHVIVAVDDFDEGNDNRQTRGYRLDIHNGRRDHEVISPFSGIYTDFLADHDGNIRYAVGTDLRGYENSYVRSVDGDWKALNTGTTLHVTLDPLGLSRDGKYAYLASNEKSDRLCLIREELASGTRDTLSCDDVADMNTVYFDSASDTPIAVLYEADHPSVRLLATDSVERAELEDLQKIFPGELAIPASKSADGSRQLIFVYSDREPGRYYLYDRKNQEAKFLFSSRPWIKPEQMSEMRPIVFKARDGQTIHGYLTIPKGSEGKNLPLVVHPHGGPFGEKDTWAWDAEVQMLASRGYAVLQMNFRGSGGFGPQFEQMGKQQWDGVMIDDMTDAARWTIQQGYADPGRVCIYGASYGGYAAMMSAEREPGLYRCVIAYAGVYDLNLETKDSDTSESEHGRGFMREFIGDDPKRLHDASPIAHLDRLKAALFLVHGKADQRVPISQANALMSALDKLHYPYETLIKYGEGHGFYSEDNNVELYTKMLDFLNRNIGASRPKTGSDKTAGATAQ